MAFHRVTFYPKNLRILNLDLYKKVAVVFEFNNEALSHTITLDKLDEATRDELLAAMVLLAKMPAPGSMEEYNAMYKADLDDAARQSERIAQQNKLKAEGDAQLAAYRNVGLLDTQKNAERIQAYIEKHAKGIYCQPSVRAAIEGERINLEWGKVAAPAAPVVTPEPVELLPSGEPRLKLGTTPSPRHSLMQLRDLDQRERAARGRVAGTFGSRF